VVDNDRISVLYDVDGLAVFTLGVYLYDVVTLGHVGHILRSGLDRILAVATQHGYSS
jgi:hypothetical protein